MAKDRPKSYQWFPRDFAAAMQRIGADDGFELEYRRALDGAFEDESYGVGSPAEWCAWGRVPSKRCAEFLRLLKTQCLECPDGTLVQIRAARDRMDQELRYRSSAERGRKGGYSSATARLQHSSSKPYPEAVAVAVTDSEESKPKHSRRAVGPEREPEGFQGFYQAYPRREGRRAASKAFSGALKRHPEFSAENLREGAEEFARVCQEEGRELRFIPLPATWLNQDRFLELFEEDDETQTQEATD